MEQTFQTGCNFAILASRISLSTPSFPSQYHRTTDSTVCLHISGPPQCSEIDSGELLINKAQIRYDLGLISLMQPVQGY